MNELFPFFNFAPSLFLSLKFLTYVLRIFFAWCFHLFVMGSVPSKMCSGRLGNCASNSPMRGNGEIAHAGIQRLAGSVAQLVIIVHLTAAFQSNH